jgi:hypothetical protein
MERIFKDMKRQVNNRLGIDLLGTHTIAEKSKSAPLMLSDFLAYTFSKCARQRLITLHLLRWPRRSGRRVSRIFTTAGLDTDVKEQFIAIGKQQLAHSARRDTEKRQPLFPEKWC